MSAKHTPGPWTFEPGGGHAPNRIVGTESIQVGGPIKRINGIGGASFSEWVCESLGDPGLPGPAANARLIAAAPELLEALQVAVAYIINHIPSQAGDYDRIEMLSMTGDAIAKAKGE